MNGKGSKQRPTNKVNFDSNYDTIFGRKYITKVCEFCKKEVQLRCHFKETANNCKNNEQTT